MAFDALILHGKPPRERYENPDLPKPHEANWLPWLKRELAARGLRAAIPQFPEPFHPVFEKYKEAFEKYEISDKTSIVTHSAGSEFILRYLSERKDVSLKQLLLVAPWSDSTGKYGDFSDYTLDENLANRVGRIVIVNSLDDSDAIQANVQSLRSRLDSAGYVELEGFGHFMIGNSMPTEAFPELLDEIEKTAG